MMNIRIHTTVIVYSYDVHSGGGWSRRQMRQNLKLTKFLHPRPSSCTRSETAIFHKLLHLSAGQTRLLALGRKTQCPASSLQTIETLPPMIPYVFHHSPDKKLPDELLSLDKFNKHKTRILNFFVCYFFQTRPRWQKKTFRWIIVSLRLCVRERGCVRERANCEKKTSEREESETQKGEIKRNGIFGDGIMGNIVMALMAY